MTYDIFRIVGLARFYALRLLNAEPVWYYIIFGVMIAACIVIPYFLGGLNFAIIISKKKYGVDIRDFGSGNAGMTNMRRTFGKKAGHITLAGDAAKTLVSCLIGYILLGRLGAFIAGFFCMMGHMFPIRYKFKGGKGVVCTAVLILMTDLGSPAYHVPVVFLILFSCFVVIVLGTKYVSLGSIMSVALLPIFQNAFDMSRMSQLAENLKNLTSYEQFLFGICASDYMFYSIISMLTAAMVIFMHRGNIKRLLNHEESKFYLGKKASKPIYEGKDDNSNEQ